MARRNHKIKDAINAKCYASENNDPYIIDSME